MTNFKIAATLLCVLIVGQYALAVLNKSQAQSSNSNEKPYLTDEAEDRTISNVYRPPPHLLKDYDLTFGGSFNGPAPGYGPPKLAQNHGPVGVHPSPPPFRQPYRLAEKPTLQYGPPNQSFGLPPSELRTKPSYSSPKLSFGSSSLGFSRVPSSQYGPPNSQYGLSEFGGAKPSVHDPQIPVFQETYGPPTKGLSVPFIPATQTDLRIPLASSSAPQSQQEPSAGDLYGPPPPPPPGVSAPPTPPDIKYDGWQPIPGLVGAPIQNELPSNSYGASIYDNGNSDSHGSSGSFGSHSSKSHLSTLTLESGKHNVPSDSYGEPIHNPDAQHLQSSVSASTKVHGLPPPSLPQSEPLHNNQAPEQWLPGHQEHHKNHQIHQKHQANHNGQFADSAILDGQVSAQADGDMNLPEYERLPEADALTEFSHGLSYSDGGSTSLVASGASPNSLHNDIESPLSMASLPSGNYATPSNCDDPHDSVGLQASGLNHLTVQHLPRDGPSFSSVFFRPRSNINGGLSRPSLQPSTSAPLSSSDSLNGPHPSSQGDQGESRFLAMNLFGHSNSWKQHSKIHHHHQHKNQRPTPPFRHGFFPGLTDNLIPPRNRAPIKFRDQVPPGLLATVNHYLPTITKPFTKYGTPLEQKLPLRGGPAFQPFTSFSRPSASGSLSAKNNHISIAAPNVHYGTPLSFKNFNTPAPVLTYGAPNFGPVTSFISTSIGGHAASHNLYDSIASDVATRTYGSPVINGDISSKPAINSVGRHDCGFQKSGAQIVKYTTLAEDAARASATGQQGVENSRQPSGIISCSSHASQFNPHHSYAHQQSQPQNSVIFNNAVSVNSDLASTQYFTHVPASSISELDLESNEQRKENFSDSYGNPINDILEHLDQTPALTTNEIHAIADFSSSALKSQEPSQNSQQQQNSYISETNSLNSDEIFTEALSATLTAQGYGEGKHFASTDLSQDKSNRYSDTHVGASREAMALAQILQSDGADGFQIQGSKGTYMLQIQAADGGLGTENSDGSIRHEQVLSNGILQDILAAIEQPNPSAVEIQGLHPSKQSQEVYDQAPASDNLPIDAQQLYESRDDTKDEVFSNQFNDDSPTDLGKSSSAGERVDIGYDNHDKNNTNLDEPKNYIRLTTKSETLVRVNGNKK